MTPTSHFVAAALLIGSSAAAFAQAPAKDPHAIYLDQAKKPPVDVCANFESYCAHFNRLGRIAEIPFKASIVNVAIKIAAAELPPK